MACETCGHTVQKLGDFNSAAHFWCPRCGTLSHQAGPYTQTEAPKLVNRCRSFASFMRGAMFSTDFQAEWHRLGIGESIEAPGRPANMGGGVA